MRQKLAKYISETLVKRGIVQNFTVTGGGAMHLNDAFGHQEGMHSLYQHHEQACAIAAEAYARIYNRPALLCVTSGPGGTNAITGVLGAWLDSIPMLVVSGQVRYDNTARWSGLALRAMGDQEFEITKAVACMTKYCEMLTDPMRVRYALEKCLYLIETGRPGPCWLDIPVDIQGTFIETDDLAGFDPEDYANGGDGWCGGAAGHSLPGDAARAATDSVQDQITPELVKTVLDKIRAARRPVFYTGNGIRIAGAEQLFLEVAHRLNIPVVVGWNGPDIIPTDDPLYAGRPGGRGDRPGNLAVQNADLIFAVGSRLNIRQVGYSYKTWARGAYVIVNDIDAEELRKPSVHSDLRIHADARLLLAALLHALQQDDITQFFQGGTGISAAAAAELRRLHGMDGSGGTDGSSCGNDSNGSRSSDDGHGSSCGNAAASGTCLSWLETCALYRTLYPTVLPQHLAPSGEDDANVYAVVDILSHLAEEGQVTVVGNGSPCVAGGQAYFIKNGTRFISQDAVAAMGYDLPAAIGACTAIHGKSAPDAAAAAERDPYWTGVSEMYPDYAKHDVILLTGDGSIQMNLQELQTIIHHQMPIKIFIINNGGYHSIRQTQNSFFGKPLVGIGVDSGVEDIPDLSFPDMEKIAAAYGYPFCRVSRNEELEDAFRQTLALSGPAICEIKVSLTQEFLPKSAAKRQPDGSLISPPLEDMAPFLSDHEMDLVMIEPRLK